MAIRRTVYLHSRPDSTFISRTDYFILFFFSYILLTRDIRAKIPNVNWNSTKNGFIPGHAVAGLEWLSNWFGELGIAGSNLNDLHLFQW